MGLSAVRIKAGAYKTVDSSGKIWYLNNEPRNPVKSRWVVSDGEGKEELFAQKGEALSWIESNESPSKPERKKSLAWDEEELRNFDFSNPANFWCD